VYWAHTYTTTHRNKTVNVDRIKHKFIALVLPAKSMLYTTYIDYHGAPMLVGTPGNCPACPFVKTALSLTPLESDYNHMISHFTVTA
jgi:hypothetical protein